MKNEILYNINPVYHKGEFAVCDKNWYYDNILIGYNRLYYITEGECVIEVNGIHHIARAGQLFFLPCNSKQTLYIENNIIKKYWIHLTLDCGGKDFTEIVKLPYFVEVDNPEKVENLFKEIIAAENKTLISDKFKQKGCMLKLVAYYLEKANFTESLSGHDQNISLILSYIEQNFSKPLTVEELSNICHFHPNYFIRWFKSKTGLTPVAYINNRRVQAAQKLLLEEHLSISDICYKVGFNSPQYFSRCFKKQTGFFPRGYRINAITVHLSK